MCLKTEETAHLERLKKLEKKMEKGVDKAVGRWEYRQVADTEAHCERG